MKQDLLVVDGYGTISRTVCSELVEKGTHTVIAAGRTPKKAQSLANSIEWLHAHVLDVTDRSTYDDALVGVNMVLRCLD